MDTVTVHDKTFEKYIDHAALMEAIDRVCDRLNADYAGSTRPPILMCTLHGALMFTSEVMQRLSFEARVACIKVSSYVGTHSTGGITSVLGPTKDVKGERVIILEDIVDTGLTIVNMRSMLAGLGAADVKVCTMLFKPESFRTHLEKTGLCPEEHLPEYYAMEIPDDFIVGFGLDYNEFGRNYPDIYKLKQ